MHAPNATDSVVDLPHRLGIDLFTTPQFRKYIKVYFLNLVIQVGFDQLLECGMDSGALQTRMPGSHLRRLVNHIQRSKEQHIYGC